MNIEVDIPTVNIDVTVPKPTSIELSLGLKGETGEKGEKGDRGEKGDKGEQGIQGIQGERGPKGEKGDQGIQGIKGDKGDTGERGPKGDKGEKGEKGQQGDPIKIYKTYPSVSALLADEANIPDGYCVTVSTDPNDEDNGKFYAKADGKLSFIVDLSGMQGIQGPKGERGEKGERGLTGDKGERGERGEQGPRGIQGERGPKGDTGPQGIQGVQGPRGEIGPKGDKGDRGEQGPKGDKPSPSEIQDIIEPSIRETINKHSTKNELDHPSRSVKERHLDYGSVGYGQLQPDSVYGSVIKNKSVTTEKLGDASVGREQLKDGSVYGLAIKNDSIENKHLAINCISQKNIQSSCIDSSNIKPKSLNPESLDRTYLQYVQEGGRARLTGYNGTLFVNGSADLGGGRLTYIATADGSIDKEAVNWVCMRNNTVTSFDGLKGDINFHNYLTRHGTIDINNLGPFDLANKGVFWAYWGGSTRNYCNGLSDFSSVLGIKDTMGSNTNGDSWQLGFDHNGGGGNSLLKYRHVTAGYSKGKDVPWITLVNEKMLDAKVKELKNAIDNVSNHPAGSISIRITEYTQND